MKKKKKKVQVLPSNSYEVMMYKAILTVLLIPGSIGLLLYILMIIVYW